MLAIALSVVLGATSKAELDLGNAAADQEAYLLAQQLVEAQRAAPITGPEWAVGVRGGSFVRPHEAAWPFQVVVTAVNDPGVAGVSYRRAQVTVSFRGRSVALEALRW